MVTKKEFNKIQAENPESRIWRRSREEQELRNDLASVLKKSRKKRDKLLVKAKKKWIETPLEEEIKRKRFLNWDMLEELHWDKNAVLENIKKYCVSKKDIIKSSTSKEWDIGVMEPFKWKMVRLVLPATWNFKWLKFECFISDEGIHRGDIRRHEDLNKDVLTLKEVWDLLRAINEYMQEYGILTDWYTDYENHVDFNNPDNKESELCIAWDCLTTILSLDKDETFWIYENDKDKQIDENWYTEPPLNYRFKNETRMSYFPRDYMQARLLSRK